MISKVYDAVYQSS